MNFSTYPQNVLIFVPGYLGSRLRERKSRRLVWLDVNPKIWLTGEILELFKTLEYPSDLEPDGLYENIMVAPPLIRQHPHKKLRELLIRLGYRAEQHLPRHDHTYYEFDHDWRQDNRISARQLGAFVDQVRQWHPDKQIWLMAHSNGGLVARWYIEKEGGKNFIDRLFLLGAPHDGTPKAFRVAFSGLDFVMRPMLKHTNFYEGTRQMSLTFPSLYQLIPLKDPFLRYPQNMVANVFEGEKWLPLNMLSKYMPYLEDGLNFTRELGNTLSIPTVNIIGTEKNTTISGVLSSQANDRWKSIQWVQALAGDGTIPMRSMRYSNALSEYPTNALHGELCVHDHVLKILRWELHDKYFDPSQTYRSATNEDDLRIEILIDNEYFVANTSQSISARIVDATNNPIQQAVVRCVWRWAETLPGDEPPSASLVKIIKTVRLLHSPNSPDIFSAPIQIPDLPGYYQVEIIVERTHKPTITATELVVVE